MFRRILISVLVLVTVFSYSLLTKAGASSVDVFLFDGFSQESSARDYVMLDIGSKGDAVVQLQHYLIELDYLTGKADGDYGKGTAAAVKKFQKAEGLEETGIADKATQQALFSKKLPSEIPGAITTVKMGKDAIGTPQVFVGVKNISKSKTIDAFDFECRCYNNYGDLIKGYGIYTSFSGTYQESKLGPGTSSKSDWRWTLYGFDTTTNVEVTLTRLHTTDGETIDIAQADQVWVKSK